MAAKARASKKSPAKKAGSGGNPKGGKFSITMHGATKGRSYASAPVSLGRKGRKLLKKLGKALMRSLSGQAKKGKR